ncbi:hypothetical protein C5167_023451 [Papaver somniferum]|uniref:Uncharacterized protein n=1 Tax=Papaver somniferum TaxID=3469 RepID=A0A4Y7JLR8_PAPSO|nr:hypothetical protein C5167_023451 [Papaver somniferum]
MENDIVLASGSYATTSGLPNQFRFDSMGMNMLMEILCLSNVCYSLHKLHDAVKVFAKLRYKHGDEEFGSARNKFSTKAQQVDVGQVLPGVARAVREV